MNQFKQLGILSLLLLTGVSMFGQRRFREHEQEDKEIRNKGKAILAHVTVGAHLPAADLAKRFGYDLNFGAGVEFLSAGNWIFGLEGQYFMGPKVKEDPLDQLRTPEGDIIGSDRSIADVLLRERGFYAGGTIGRLFPIGKNRSGIRTTIGAGYMQHHIRLLDNSQSVTQITGDYAAGYDRLSGGFGLNQFIGWQHLGTNRRSNFFIGFEFNEGFTHSIREWDYSLMRNLNEKRFDMRFGIRAGWTLPFYVGEPEKIFY